MNPFTFIKDSYNQETLLKARELGKLEIQLAKSRTARIFNLRCLANKVTPKTLQIKLKGNKFEQAIIKKAECSSIHNRIKCINIKINHLQTEIANTKISLQQKLDEPTFTDLQNITFNNKGKTFLQYKNTQSRQVGNQHLKEGANTRRKVFTTERPTICSYPSNHPHQGIHLLYYRGSSPGR